MSCPSCRGSLPATSAFCPRCGYYIARDQAVQANPGGAAAPRATARSQPIAAPAAPALQATQTAHVAPAMQAVQIAPAAPAAPAQQAAQTPPAAPAAAAIEPRVRRATPPMAMPATAAPDASGQPPLLPGTPTFIPITPRPRLIVLGIVLIGIGIWALLAYLPANKIPPVAAPGARYWLSEEAYYAGSVAAFALVLAGITVAIGAALHRAQTEVLCRECNRQVIGWKHPFGLMCPLGKHYARVSWPVLVATIGFWVLVVICMAIVAFVVLL